MTATKLPYDFCSLAEELGLEAPVIMECGAGPWLEFSKLMHMASRYILIDPIVQMLELHKKTIQPREGLVMEYHNVAIHPAAKEVTMARRPLIMKHTGHKGGGSFIKGIGWHPKRNPGRGKNWATVKVKASPLYEIDKGEVDMLLLDMEGSEWFALHTMQSRPALIVIELFDFNPFLGEIKTWLKNEDYTLHPCAKGRPTNQVYYLNPNR